ncbi:hypothetical protein Tco_0576913 [Tanacetum coccineum]
MPPKDEVFLSEEQPLLVVVSPTADSPGYIAYSDLEEDPEEDPADYPADEGDDDDDNDESSDDDEDDDDDVKEEEDEDNDDEEEEHPTLADYVPPPVHRISSPPLPVSSPVPVSPSPLPASPTYPLGYRDAMIRLRAETPQLLPIPLPTLSPPLLLPSIDCRAGVSEVTLPPRKWLCIALGLRYEVDESLSALTARPIGGFRANYGFVSTLDDEIRRDPKRYVSYGITDTWDEMVEDMHGTPAATDVARLSQRMTNFVMTVRDRCAHARTTRLMETEAKLSREAWVDSMDASDTARSEVTTLQSQQGPASVPAQPKIPEEAGSST